jgi:hypothetical protein
MTTINAPRLNRRLVLKGLGGAALTLPLLEAFQPRAAHAQSVEGVEGVGAKLYPCADLADVRCLFKHLDLEALARQCQGGCKTANAATGNQHRKVCGR